MYVAPACPTFTILLDKRAENGTDGPFFVANSRRIVSIQQPLTSQGGKGWGIIDCISVSPVPSLGSSLQIWVADKKYFGVGSGCVDSVLT